MTAKVCFKQNIGHIGQEVVVTGVHGHRHTMIYRWAECVDTFWNLLAAKIETYGTKFLAGDFNMSFTEVVKQLGRRNIVCDCIAWYPWRHEDMLLHDQNLAFDSCGIFYIGGTVQVSLRWGLRDIPKLTAVAGELTAVAGEELDTYGGQNHPGQHWSAYRIKKEELNADKSLRQRLEDLLAPSTTKQDLDLLASQRPRGNFYCPYLRLKQKPLDKGEWLVDAQVHNGAHFPLQAHTNNARARSAEKAIARAEKSKGKAKGKGKEQSGKGKHATAVAEESPNSSAVAEESPNSTAVAEESKKSAPIAPVASQPQPQSQTQFEGYSSQWWNQTAGDWNRSSGSSSWDWKYSTWTWNAWK